MIKGEDFIDESVVPDISWKTADFHHLNNQYSVEELIKMHSARAMADLVRNHPGTRVDSANMEGKIDSFSQFKKIIDEQGGRFLANYYNFSPEQETYDHFTFCVVWQHAFLTGNISEKNWLDFTFNCLDRDLFLKVVEPMREILKKRTSQRDFYMLTKNMDGFDLTNINVKASPLIRENYEQSVIDDVDHVLKELKESDPCGRITIIEGPPGTGKTHLVRGLVRETQDCTVVLFTPTIMSEFSAPGILTAFLGFRKQSEGPMVLVLEDGDQCLASRKFDNITSINEILGLSDGILGAALDIRIIVTTNTKHADIDEAILRPGRLCRHIVVGKLSLETEKKVMHRLGVPGVPAGRSLAEIYEASKGNNPNVEKKRTVGFGS